MIPRTRLPQSILLPGLRLVWMLAKCHLNKVRVSHSCEQLNSSETEKRARGSQDTSHTQEKDHKGKQTLSNTYRLLPSGLQRSCGESTQLQFVKRKRLALFFALGKKKQTLNILTLLKAALKMYSSQVKLWLCA